MGAPSARLYGDGVPDEVLHRVAAKYGLDAQSIGSRPADRSAKNIVLLASVTLAELQNWLTLPVDAFIEYVEEEDQINPETLDGLNTGKLCFSLATSTAYQNDSAAIVCEALVARGVLTPMRRSDVELSLHETISNAVVHGNLALESNTTGDLQHFAKFALELQSRMHSEEAKRRIDVQAGWDSEFLDISVADKGRGYDQSKLPVNIDPFAPAGRGLSIIRSLALSANVTHGGRVTTLRFLT